MPLPISKAAYPPFLSINGFEPSEVWMSSYALYPPSSAISANDGSCSITDRIPSAFFAD
ncbi:hypothetical protein GGI05_002643, partial [Coemansia sp. RSA 2603]